MIASMGFSLNVTYINLFSLRNSAIGYMFASFQMSTFLTWSSLVFPLAHRSMRISVVWNFLSPFCLTAQHSAPYTMAGFIAVLYNSSFNFVGTSLSHITPVVSLHFDQAIFPLLFTSFSAPPFSPAARGGNLAKIPPKPGYCWFW